MAEKSARAQVRPARSHLFTVRVWEESVSEDCTEWRGKVQLTTNGDARYFRQWDALLTLLPAMLAEARADEP
jgi:hypothetical protein